VQDELLVNLQEPLTQEALRFLQNHQEELS
jgi:hypothetical protein